jgi:uncharacterized paraquat-inducible protein A
MRLKMSFKHCPGIKDLVDPGQITIRSCPACGEEVEFFTGETEAQCPKCKRTLHIEATPSCVTWCDYAIDCIEDLKARKLMPPTRAEELKHIAKKKK